MLRLFGYVLMAIGAGGMYLGEMAGGGVMLFVGFFCLLFGLSEPGLPRSRPRKSGVKARYSFGEGDIRLEVGGIKSPGYDPDDDRYWHKVGGEDDPDAGEPQGEWYEYQNKHDQPDVPRSMEEHRFR
ncbi:hypothetical protein ACKC9G_13275 [Pokkaliibacter sp. CJK22405]|uniref:hypothetical protein n=1 Tax=Pokkaliibacter sp. CJK22405 TaxID=3384615 RepID=UPI0039846CCA